LNWVRPYIRIRSRVGWPGSGPSTRGIQQELGEVVVEQVDDEHDLVAARTTAAQADGSAEATALVTLLLTEVPLAALAFVHGVGGESASATEVGAEGVLVRGEILTVSEPEGFHTVGVGAVGGAAPSWLVTDQAEAGPVSVTGTVTHGVRSCSRRPLRAA
jgi:hypothetical protein